MLNSYTETQRLGYYFKEFLDLIDSADLTLSKEISGTGVPQDDIRFNRIPSLSKYQIALKNTYREMSIELDKHLQGISQKIDILNYLARYIVEIEGCGKLLVKDSDESLRHLSFNFSNISENADFREETLAQSDIQDYLLLIYLSIGKCKSHLLALRHNFELIPQNDLPVPTHLLPGLNESTLESPLAFFEYLIRKNGLAEIKRNFVPTEDDYEYNYHISYDEKAETRIIYDQNQETGEWEGEKTDFSTTLRKELYRELFRSQSLIDEKINKSSKKEIKLFILLTLNQLKYLISMISNTESLRKYEDVSLQVKNIIIYLFEKYGPFCPECDDDFKESLKNSSLYKIKTPAVRLLPTSANPGVFKWMKGDSTRLSTLLHAELNTVYIEDTELLHLHRAFEGGYPEAPLKIKWINRPVNKSHMNKVTLLYLFKKLSEAELIDVSFESNHMVMKLDYIFADSRGERIQNWPQSKKSVNDAKKQTHSKKEIDRIVTFLAS